MTHDNKIYNNPFELFKLWFEENSKVEKTYNNTMTLSVSDKENQPSSRVVLLKDFNEEGFVFFGNYNSYKMQTLMDNPKASLLFYFKELGKQIQIWGNAEIISSYESDKYFATRPRESQIGAWASKQSEIQKTDNELEMYIEQYTEKFKDRPVPRPDHWGGMNIVPYRFEFWSEKTYRLHERHEYLHQGSSWKINKLFP